MPIVILYLESRDSLRAWHGFECIEAHSLADGLSRPLMVHAPRRILALARRDAIASEFEVCETVERAGRQRLDMAEA